MIFLNRLILGVSILVLCILWLSNAGNMVGSHATPNINQTALVKIDNFNITALVATTPDQQSKGLAIKDTMKENEGMLFVFDTPKKYSFWMKDMKFPIDIIWIDSNKKIVHIERSLEPCLFLLPCQSYTPIRDSLYVLEVVSNFTNKHNIKIGDQVLFDNFGK